MEDAIGLYPYQLDAIRHMKNGCILCGGVGSGKSRTGLAYYYLLQGGKLGSSYYEKMINPKDLYIITTARKRDTLEWEKELIPFRLSVHPEATPYTIKVVIDSWNNIKKYENVGNAFFIFDEQRVVGKGAWVKSFLKITKVNSWILLSATPGDTWSDYIPVFIANGFYKNRTEFTREHIVYSPASKFPKVERYLGTGRLIKYRNSILVNMDFKRQTESHHEDIYCDYDILSYKDVIRKRWDPFKNEPIQNAAGFCYILRKIANSSDDRQLKLLEIVEQHPRVIIFYNFDYELELLKNLEYGYGVKVAEWNGHRHEPIPNSKRWVYLCQYVSGAEGWNCLTTDTIIFYSQTYSYKTLEQAAGRIDRLNTPFHDLYYYHLKSRSSIDIAISRALSSKKKFNEQKFASF